MKICSQSSRFQRLVGKECIYIFLVKYELAAWHMFSEHKINKQKRKSMIIDTCILTGIEDFFFFGYFSELGIWEKRIFF